MAFWGRGFRSRDIFASDDWIVLDLSTLRAFYHEIGKANLVCDAFCVQRYMQLHEEVELSALGMGKFLHSLKLISVLT